MLKSVMALFGYVCVKLFEPAEKPFWSGSIDYDTEAEAEKIVTNSFGSVWFIEPVS